MNFILNCNQIYRQNFFSASVNIYNKEFWNISRKFKIILYKDFQDFIV